MKPKTRLDEIAFINKWKQKYWGDYTLIGISKFYFHVNKFSWRLSFFGFEIHFWFEHEF